MQAPAREAELARIEEQYPFPRSEVNRLAKRAWILDQLGRRRGTVGMEVGVFRGHFSEVICRALRPRKLYLIDVWTLLGERFGWGKLSYTNDDELPTAVAMREAVLRCGRYPEVEAVVVESSFPECRDQVEEPLDWAYLDASHQYAHTLRELRALDSMMTADSVIMGDDWHVQGDHPHHGVLQAVHAFVAESDWRITAAGPGLQWAIRRLPYAPAAST